jgi:hypothetical protein
MNDTRMRGRILLAPKSSLAEKMFHPADIPAIRCLAASFGARAGMSRARLADFVLAVSEAAACATHAGPCTARLRLWAAGPRAFCEVHGDGMVLRQAGDRMRRGDDEAEALRRWMLRQVCDHARLESGPRGVTVRFSMAVG